MLLAEQVQGCLLVRLEVLAQGVDCLLVVLLELIDLLTVATLHISLLLAVVVLKAGDLVIKLLDGVLELL
jgi:hypothetical protein